jgi:hypothetical protein
MKRLIDHILEEKICYSTVKSEKNMKEIDEKANNIKEEDIQNKKENRLDEKNKKNLTKNNEFLKI